MKRILLLFLILITNFVQGQLVVNNASLTPAQLVQTVLLGAGVTATNIKYNGTTAAANTIQDQVGQFSNGVATNIGIDNGVILSTGKAQGAIGPNNIGSFTLLTSNPMGGDSDLAAIASSSINTKSVKINISTLFIAQLFSNSVTIEFVFNESCDV